MRISGLVALAFNAYQLLLLARVILSWMSLSTQHRVYNQFSRNRSSGGLYVLSSFVYAATEPLLRPIRNLLARYQGGMPVDFSPMVLWLLLYVVEGLLLRFLMIAGL